MLVLFFFFFDALQVGFIECRLKEGSVHFCEFRRSTTGDLLNTKVGKVLLEFVELLGQVGLGLGPQFRCLDAWLYIYIKQKKNRQHFVPNLQIFPSN